MIRSPIEPDVLFMLVDRGPPFRRFVSGLVWLVVAALIISVLAFSISIIGFVSPGQ